ncbi:putative F-box/FBD/LRR-repeat protein at5g44950 [Phtheirospermum japonicum]|uniref:Putative F-box/FBD/LRR-repeat protein at5g44950 n=1 Tax=Phtheirospermum japonicum TaxID=374723 RepID=A0A830C336_9LAMI|nr:putative F-box/FBD/LRR-repeat protein at5g44950 [Phtheirospermum japonicum]
MEANNNVDLISQLSDDILISIMARLRTEEAVRTSILSNRWRNLYKFIPDIEFRCEHLVGRSVFSPHDSNSIINGVDRFLRLRSGFKIRSLKLSCCLMKLLHTDRYEQFIYSLGRLGIEKLVLRCSCCQNPSDLSFSCHLLSQMPSLRYFDLFDCSLHQMPSLKYFEVGLCSLHHPMPASLKLTQSNNSLQVLRLNRVIVVDGALECILSNCLSLDSLSIESCEFPSKLFIRGPNLQLKRLRIDFVTGVEEIELYASNLVRFEFRSNEVVNFRFDHAPKLENISLDFQNQNAMSYVRTRLVKDLPHLKSLFVASKGDIYKVSMKNQTLRNLRQLKLHIYVTKVLSLLTLAPFLKSCPVLQEFHLDTEFVEYNEVGVKGTDVAVIHTGLKKVEITGHTGTKSEIEFALYILKSAICLEQMQISRCPKWYGGYGRWMGHDQPGWSAQTLYTIRKYLIGQAISKTARVTIQHSPFYEFNWMRRDTHFGSSIFD